MEGLRFICPAGMGLSLDDSAPLGEECGMVGRPCHNNGDLPRASKATTRALMAGKLAVLVAEGPRRPTLAGVRTAGEVEARQEPRGQALRGGPS
jgi:hypothetical protein